MGLAAAASLSWIPSAADRSPRSCCHLHVRFPAPRPVTGSDKPVLWHNGAGPDRLHILALVPVAVHAFRSATGSQTCAFLAVPIERDRVCDRRQWREFRLAMGCCGRWDDALWSRWSQPVGTALKDGADSAGSLRAPRRLRGFYWCCSRHVVQGRAATLAYPSLRSGALAGIATTPMRAADIARIEEADVAGSLTVTACSSSGVPSATSSCRPHNDERGRGSSWGLRTGNRSSTSNARASCPMPRSSTGAHRDSWRDRSAATGDRSSPIGGWLHPRRDLRPVRSLHAQLAARLTTPPRR